MKIEFDATMDEVMGLITVLTVVAVIVIGIVTAVR